MQAGIRESLSADAVAATADTLIVKTVTIIKGYSAIRISFGSLLAANLEVAGWMGTNRTLLLEGDALGAKTTVLAVRAGQVLTFTSTVTTTVTLFVEQIKGGVL